MGFGFCLVSFFKIKRSLSFQAEDKGNRKYMSIIPGHRPRQEQSKG